MTRTSAPRTNVERSLLEVEAFLRDFADDSPHVTVTLLRFANVLGDDLDTPFAIALRRPVVPEILGFDPRVQFVHSDDVVGALMYATNHDVPGVYNVAGDGNMPWSEVCAIVGKPRVPLSPWFTNLLVRAAPAASACGTCRPRRSSCCATAAPSTTVASSTPDSPTSYTNAGTVESFARGLRLAKTIGDKHPAYRYEREVEDFFRHSPAVIRRD